MTKPSLKVLIQLRTCNQKSLENKIRISKAPALKSVWNKFTKFVDQYNWKGEPFFAPIPVGYNIIGFDMIIINRLCQQFGQWDNTRQQQKLFSKVYKVDLMDNMFKRLKAILVSNLLAWTHYEIVWVCLQKMHMMRCRMSRIRLIYL